MKMKGLMSLVLLLALASSLASPLPEDQVNSKIDKRQLDDPMNGFTPGFNPFISPYGPYPGLPGIGVKPLRPILPSFFLNRFATPPPPIDPMASFFKAKKDEFLNKLFNDITIDPESAAIQVRSAVDPPTEDLASATEIPTTTTKPKIDPSVFINKKFDFLAELFKAINSTTVAPPADATTDPTATTVKPTIVPPGFWVPFPKPAKPLKPTKPPKPAKTDSLLLNAIDNALLKSILEQMDPANPALLTPEASAAKATRQVVDLPTEDPAITTEIPTTTKKPKIDPSVFISKKFDFLTELFKAINSTTVAPPADATTDPTATTVKPTIVPPGFWVPVPKPAKPLKPTKLTKAPKPEKTKSLLLKAIDDAMLKSILEQMDPANPTELAPEAAASKATRQVSFLDKLLHRVTEVPPTEAPIDSSLQTRSLLFPPGYWIPPYIYAAKMGIYLDKMFDTIDEAATSDTTGDLDKRSADPSSLILAELTTLKNDMLAAYLEGMKSAKATPSSAKAPLKPFKKPLWGPATKTTAAPDVAQQKVELLSDVFDKLAAIQGSLLAEASNVTSPAPTTTDTTVPTTASPDFWAPDPTAADIGEYYKTKTHEFLASVFASIAPPASTDEA